MDANQVAESHKAPLLPTGTISLGVNYWASHAGTHMWADWREDVVRADFVQLASAGLTWLRVFPLWPDFQPIERLATGGGTPFEVRFGEDPLPDTPAGQDGVDARMLLRLRTLCDLAGEHGLRLIVGLVTGWMSGRLFIPPALANRPRPSRVDRYSHHPSLPSVHAARRPRSRHQPAPDEPRGLRDAPLRRPRRQALLRGRNGNARNDDRQRPLLPALPAHRAVEPVGQRGSRHALVVRLRSDPAQACALRLDQRRAGVGPVSRRPRGQADRRRVRGPARRAARSGRRHAAAAACRGRVRVDARPRFLARGVQHLVPGETGRAGLRVPSLLVAINHHHETVSERLALAAGWRLERILHGQGRTDGSAIALDLPRNSAALVTIAKG